ncbi:hypothetical protein SESBI_16614 [Sesbania bispinosa]|nr:hypothetical protein SESBI_16614 [Sesbania bispinosa]
MSQVVASEFCTTNANDIRGTASSTKISKNIDSDTVDQLKGDLPELHLKLSDGNKTQHLDIEGGAHLVGSTNIISPTNSGPIEVTGAANISQNISEPIEVTAPNDENEKQEKSNEKKKDVTTKKKPKQKVTATPTYYQPVKPRQFIGFYVCKEFDGVRTLGTVDSYDHKNNLFKVEYDDCRIEHLEQNELVRNKATDKDISKAQEALKKSNDSKKNGGGKKKNPASERDQFQGDRLQQGITMILRRIIVAKGKYQLQELDQLKVQQAKFLDLKRMNIIKKLVV